jgi:hypothetical protein
VSPHLCEGADGRAGAAVVGTWSCTGQSWSVRRLDYVYTYADLFVGEDGTVAAAGGSNHAEARPCLLALVVGWGYVHRS